MADLNHRLMDPPFLRIVDRRAVPAGAELVLWELRIGQPNVAAVPMPVIHSMEHFLASHMRGASPVVINVGVMGCQTGLYINTAITSFPEMAHLVAAALSAVGDATDVPLANPIQCGAFENHSLEGAKELARWILARRDTWTAALTDAGAEVHA